MQLKGKNINLRGPNMVILQYIKKKIRVTNGKKEASLQL